MPCNAHHRHAHNKDDDDEEAAIEQSKKKNKKQKLYVLSSIAIVGYALKEAEMKNQTV